MGSIIMRLNLILELLDVPGQLLDVLNPIGKLGANIVAVIHQRDVKTERGTIPVQITIEGDEDTLNKVIKVLQDNNIQIIQVDGILLKEKIITILIGAIVDQDVKDTVNIINQLEGVRVADLDLKVSDHPQESASKIIIEADTGKKKLVTSKLKEIGYNKGFLVITEV